MRLKDKVAVVAGGASGIGRAIAVLFAQEGARVVIADIDEQKMSEVTFGVKEAGGYAIAIKVDIVNEQQVQHLVGTALKEFQRIDILINTVGLFEFSPGEEITVHQWRRMLDVNLTGVFICCKEIGKVMIRQRYGKIVNFASTAGLSAVPYSAHYTAAKHGIVGLTKALGVEWGKYNIHVNCICPGATATPMLLESTTEEYRAERSKRIPLQRLGKPEEQANVALFLSSHESDYINGSIICVDGGVYAVSPATGTDSLINKP